MTLKKALTGFGAAAAALALVLSGTPSSFAAPVPTGKAKAGDECARAGMVAKSRGVEGSNLTCTLMTTTSYAGELRWWYKDLKPLTNLDWVVPANPGGYSQTSTAISESLKKEGLLSTYTSVFKPGWSNGNG
ncbi:MAG: hypothetical protein EB043_04690 [Actinobacteria bacterium]|nr:hypothetical protein [Actinomycetota bacterium]